MKPETFSQRLKRLRQARDWSQHDLARESGLTRVTISHLEAGRKGYAGNSPKAETLVALARAFGHGLALWDDVQW